MTFIFLTDLSAVWRHKANVYPPSQWKMRTNASSAQICTITRPFSGQNASAKVAASFVAMPSASFSHLSLSCVHEPLLFLFSYLLPLPRFRSTNWKTSLIILVLAQIWWDQRWPAGCGRGADGRMLKGPRQRPFRF